MRVSEPQRLARASSRSSSRTTPRCSRSARTRGASRATRRTARRWRAVADRATRSRSRSKMRIVMSEARQADQEVPRDAEQLARRRDQRGDEALEAEHSARRSCGASRTGVLYISERHYSPELMTLGPQLIDASLTDTKRAIGRRRSRCARSPRRPRRRRRARRSRRTRASSSPSSDRSSSALRLRASDVYAHGATSTAEARALGLAHLARVLQPRKTIHAHDTVHASLAPRRVRTGWVDGARA
jgi:hypothetical protein